MKFEASRVVQTVEQLGEARFTGSGGLENVLDFIAERFHTIRWKTERREVHKSAFHEATPMLVARPAVSSAAAVRVVFLARLAAVYLPMTRARWLIGKKAESPVTGRSGPAFLLELARSWRVSRLSEIEMTCVTTTGRRSNDTDAREILREIHRDSAVKPTLMVTIHGPGIGQELIIVGRRLQALAVRAAEDLWIPYGTTKRNPFRSPSLSWPFQSSHDDSLVLFGQGCLAGKDAELDPAALDRAAQLCTEVALRWARLHRLAPKEDRTSSRSFQNPG
jgi:hypothetical protein